MIVDWVRLKVVVLESDDWGLCAWSPDEDAHRALAATPDYERMARPGGPLRELPVLRLPEVPSRWRRPGLWDEVRAAIAAGVWWPELHGLHHLPARAWLDALTREDPDAKALLEALHVLDRYGFRAEAELAFRSPAQA